MCRMRIRAVWARLTYRYDYRGSTSTRKRTFTTTTSGITTQVSEDTGKATPLAYMAASIPTSMLAATQ